MCGCWGAGAVVLGAAGGPAAGLAEQAEVGGGLVDRAVRVLRAAGGGGGRGDALVQQVQGAPQVGLDLVQLGVRGVGGEGLAVLAEEAEGAAQGGQLGVVHESMVVSRRSP